MGATIVPWVNRVYVGRHVACAGYFLRSLAILLNKNSGMLRVHLVVSKFYFAVWPVSLGLGCTKKESFGFSPDRARARRGRWVIYSVLKFLIYNPYIIVCAVIGLILCRW